MRPEGLRSSLALSHTRVVQNDHRTRFDVWREQSLDVGIEDVAVHGSVDEQKAMKPSEVCLTTMVWVPDLRNGTAP